MWASVLFQLSEELLNKWLSYPESQHVPLCQHMLGFAMKSVTQMVMGSTFEDDQEVIRFQKNHGTVSPGPNYNYSLIKLINNVDFASQE